jgi:hypothetical protein
VLVGFDVIKCSLFSRPRLAVPARAPACASATLGVATAERARRALVWDRCGTMLSSSLACLTCALRPYMPCFLMHAYTCKSQRPWARSGLSLDEVWMRCGRGLDEVWMRSGACLGHVWLVWVTSGSRLGRRLGLDPRVGGPLVWRGLKEGPYTDPSVHLSVRTGRTEGWPKAPGGPACGLL